MHRLAACIAAAIGAALVASPGGVDANVSRSNHLVSRKSRMATLVEAPPVFLGTIVQTHTDERVPLDDFAGALRLAPRRSRDG